MRPTAAGANGKTTPLYIHWDGFSIGPLLVLFLIAQTYASFHDVLRDNNKSQSP